MSLCREKKENGEPCTCGVTRLELRTDELLRQPGTPPRCWCGHLIGDHPEAASAANTELQEVLQKVEAYFLGHMHCAIIIKQPIPPSLLDAGTVCPSDIIGKRTADPITFFNSLMDFVNDDWQPALTAAADRNLNSIEATVADAGFGLVDVQNSNNFNVRVTVEDPDRNSVTFSSRVDYIIVASPSITRDMILDVVLHHAVMFVEKQSGDLTMEQSRDQLMLCLKGIATYASMHVVFGVVIDKDFSTAQLVKYQHHAAFADGIFHPSMLGAVCQDIRSHPERFKR